MADIPHSEVPDYSDPATGGSMVRAAAWLAAVVGEGGIFTKEQLREAIPNVAQIDRRVRDLRDYGWVIEESRMGRDLDTNEQRLVTIGVPVWDPEARRAATPMAISARVREEVFFRDGHACVRCGIAAGEAFDDAPHIRARLTAGHLYPSSLGGRATASDLVTTCQRCNESIQQSTHNYLNAQQVMVRIQSLGKPDRARLLRRMESNMREPDRVDNAWREFRQLPGVEREAVKAALKKLLED